MSPNGVVVITGASSGLGAATGEVFADAGWNVVLAARRRGRLEELAGRLDRAPGSALAVPTDVSDPRAVDALIDATLDRFGGVDVLINSAANDHPGPISELSVQQWREIADVNLNGVSTPPKPSSIRWRQQVAATSSTSPQWPAARAGPTQPPTVRPSLR